MCTGVSDFDACASRDDLRRRQHFRGVLQLPVAATMYPPAR
jgi:hypothetical protein